MSRLATKKTSLLSCFRKQGADAVPLRYNVKAVDSFELPALLCHLLEEVAEVVTEIDENNVDNLIDELRDVENVAYLAGLAAQNLRSKTRSRGKPEIEDWPMNYGKPEIVDWPMNYPYARSTKRSERLRLCILQTIAQLHAKFIGRTYTGVSETGAIDHDAQVK